MPFASLKSKGKSVTELDGSLIISSSLVVLSKLMLLAVLSLMSNCSSNGSVLAIVLMDVDLVAAAVGVAGGAVAVIAAICVAFESLDSEIIACVDDLVVRFVVVVFTVVDLIVRLVLVIIVVGFVVRLVVDLSVVDID